jgi:hypothetical protein
MNSEECWKKRSWPTLIYYISIFLEGRRKITTHLRRDSRLRTVNESWTSTIRTGNANIFLHPCMTYLSNLTAVIWTSLWAGHSLLVFSSCYLNLWEATWGSHYQCRTGIFLTRPPQPHCRTQRLLLWSSTQLRVYWLPACVQHANTEPVACR